MKNTVVSVAIVATFVCSLTACGQKSPQAAATITQKNSRTVMKSDKEWIAVQDAEVVLAQYNDPFTPPWKRRNEVQISVMKKS